MWIKGHVSALFCHANISLSTSRFFAQPMVRDSGLLYAGCLLYCSPLLNWRRSIVYSNITAAILAYPIRNFLGNIQGLRWAGLQCHVRFLLVWPTHYRGLMAGICRVYWGKLPTMRPTIYSCLWWDNPTSSPNNMWALPMHYQGHFPRYTQDIIMEFL